MAVPRLLIDFKQGDYGSFVIEELTFNPYISRESILKANPVDIWMEFSIRRIKNDNLVQGTPDIRLIFYGDSSDIFTPTTQIPRHIAGIENAGDMNFIMYSNIWYSFVRLEGQDREFMEHGYRKPIRVISSISNGGSNSSPVSKDSWITGGYLAFRRGRYQKEADDLRDRILKFHQRLLPIDMKKDSAWNQETMRQDDKDISCWMLSDRDIFAPVYFEVTDTPLQGRFAVRRKPWNEEATDKYGIGYGGTAEIIPVNETEHILRPKTFCEQDSKPIQAQLRKDELIRFWIYFQSKSCLTVSKSKTDRISFAFQIEVNPKIETFNSFFRAPTGFEPIPGAITRLLHYSTPPRLFFLWDQYFPEQCFAYNRNLQKTNARIELSSAFEDKTAETDRLVKIFVLGVFISFLADLNVGAVLNPEAPGSLLDRFNLEYTSAVALLMGLVPAVRVYVGKRIKLARTMISLSYVTICALPFSYDSRLGATLLLFFFILWITSLQLGVFGLFKTRCVFKNILPKRIIRFINRRKYLSKLKGGSKK